MVNDKKVKIIITRQCQIDGKTVKPGEKGKDNVVEVSKDVRNILVGGNKAKDYEGKE